VAYGSYEELVTDKNVDVVYIATPHSHHYQNALLALEAGKNVLCEKAFTVNAAQARRLVATARAKGLFLMEAVWTRYFPLSVQIRRMIEDQELGAVYRVIADLSLANDVEERFGTEHRMVNLNLAGGALLDRELAAWPTSPLFPCARRLLLPSTPIATVPRTSG
jgi:predicted dehydrogenase